VVRTLASTTREQIYLGNNLCMVGNEVIGYTTATQTGAGSYILSELLRGAKGTEYATGTHAAMETFVSLAADSSIMPVKDDLDRRGITRYIKAVTQGTMVEAAPPVAYTPMGNRIKPISPVHVRASRDGSDNITLTWVRRARMAVAWVDGLEAPLDEPTEAYEIDIMDGSTVKRTLTATSPTVAYSVANQTTDFGSAQASVTVMIYQMSSRVGRGWPRTATV
jgi:hypothetical protein